VILLDPFFSPKIKEINFTLNFLISFLKKQQERRDMYHLFTASYHIAKAIRIAIL
jgi:hypothetical protein